LDITFDVDEFTNTRDSRTTCEKKSDMITGIYQKTAAMNAAVKHGVHSGWSK